MLAPILALALSLQGDKPLGPRESGEWLEHTCKEQLLVWDFPNRATDADVLEAHGCYDYVRGYLDGILKDCLRSKTIKTAIVEYVAYMQKHPEMQDAYKGVGLRKSIRDANPCAAQ